MIFFLFFGWVSNYNIILYDNLCSLTLEDQGNVSLIDPFTHTEQESEKVRNFDFWVKSQNTKEREKVKIDETFCTLVTVGGKFLEKTNFKKVLKKIHQIRRKFREYLLTRSLKLKHSSI